MQSNGVFHQGPKPNTFAYNNGFFFVTIKIFLGTKIAISTINYNKYHQKLKFLSQKGKSEVVGCKNQPTDPYKLEHPTRRTPPFFPNPLQWRPLLFSDLPLSSSPHNNQTLEPSPLPPLNPSPSKPPSHPPTNQSKPHPPSNTAVPPTKASGRKPTAVAPPNAITSPPNTSPSTPIQDAPSPTRSTRSSTDHAPAAYSTSNTT